jgi:hypothetical protein
MMGTATLLLLSFHLIPLVICIAIVRSFLGLLAYRSSWFVMHRDWQKLAHRLGIDTRLLVLLFGPFHKPVCYRPVATR